MDDVRLAFGRRLRQFRVARGWSQEKLAERASLHLTYVGGIERGERNPALDNINRLASALHVPLAELFQDFTKTLATAHRRRPRRTRRAT